MRVAICNVQNGIGTTRGYWHYLLTGWKYRFPHGSGPIRRAARFLRAERIDLAALCEIERGARRTRGVDQVALLAEGAGLPGRVFFPAFVVGDRINQGNAVCTRFPIREVHNHLLPGPGEPRYLSEAEVAFHGVDVRLFVTHLSLQRTLRASQIHRIAEVIGRQDRPIILAGDFNISEEAELDLLVESALQKAASAPTFPAWRPVRRLDHLFVSRHFAIRRSYAAGAYRFSDHLPFVAEVVLNDPGA
jgi:endonuclease/exonuclease/phosphatase family metal-dependent hydrolase